MNRLSDLMYMQPQQEQEYPLFPDINQQIRYGMQYAQNRVPAGMQKQIIENDPELFGPRPTAPTVAPGPGNYSAPHNPQATVQTPDGRYVTPQEFEMLQRRLRERDLRMKR